MTYSPKLIIAVDGFSSCGKSTFAKAIARRMGFVYVDTGAMYRAATLFGLQQGAFADGVFHRDRLISLLDAMVIEFRRDEELQENVTWLNGRCVESEIRSLEVSGWVSDVSAVREVRHHLVRLQQRMGEKGGLVMDGRDIGTTVFPGADIKIFMTAGVDIRAQRRFLELQQKGVVASYQEIRDNIEKRDHIDQSREESPLRQAADAMVLDNSFMTPQQQMVWFDQLLIQKRHPLPKEETV